MGIRLTTWNIAWFGQLLKGRTRTLPMHARVVSDAAGRARQELQKEMIAEEIRRIDPDILCIQEGPSTGNVKHLEAYCADYLDGQWQVITRPKGDAYYISGSQGIYFLVKATRLDEFRPRLLAQSAWIEATEMESRVNPMVEDSGEHTREWPIIHPLFKPGKAETVDVSEDEDAEGEAAPTLHDREHRHWRHPQVLVCTIGNQRFDIIGVHLKSKFGGSDYHKAGRARQKEKPSAADLRLIRKVEQTAVESRIKLSTEAANIRYYIENRFRNEPVPALFVVGDMNDGIGKEVFERKYLFHDAVSNLQGDVFFANRFLNHALFDYSQGPGQNHRWTTRFFDVWDPLRPPEALIDHIVFTQGVVGSTALDDTGLRVRGKAGRVEHEIHNAVNAVFEREEDHTSDHRPVTVDILTAADLVA